MNMEALVNEICDRVQAKIEELENVAAAASGRPRILVLASERTPVSTQILENERLSEFYEMDCALQMKDGCSVDGYEAVIACTMSNQALGKIANGIFDCDYTRLMGQALLKGKKIFVPSEEVELYGYCGTAPLPYYQKLEENLKLLEDSKVVFAPAEQIPEYILHGPSPQARLGTEEREKKSCAKSPKRAASLTKKIITEKDMIALGNEKIQEVLIREKAILTDLAREYAAKHRIIVQRGEVSSEKRERGL